MIASASSSHTEHTPYDVLNAVAAVTARPALASSVPVADPSLVCQLLLQTQMSPWPSSLLTLAGTSNAKERINQVAKLEKAL